MGVYRCTSCGAVREARCKPRKCKECGATEFERQDAPQKKGVRDPFKLQMQEVKRRGLS